MDILPILASSEEMDVLPSASLTGSLSSVMMPTTEIQTLVASLKPVAEMKIGRTFPMFNAIAFRKQVVAGINYFVKVQVGTASCIHLKIRKPLTGPVQLMS